MTLRARLVMVLAVLTGLGLVVSGIATYGALRSFLYDRIDAQLDDLQPLALRTLTGDERGRGPAGTGPPRANLPISAYAELRDAAGTTIERDTFGFQEQPGSVPALPPSDDLSTNAVFTVGAVGDPGYRFRVLTAPIDDGSTLIVAIPTSDAEDTLGRLLGIEVIVATALLLATALAAWTMVRRELRPLDEMAEAASEIAAGDLTRRVRQDGRTEVGRLGGALNKMLGDIEDAFEAQRSSEERMRRFLGDASHELRTPLTSIRGYAELFRRGAAERPEDLELSMQRIEDEAERMGVLVGDLLLLANADRTRPMGAERVELTALATDSAESASLRAPGRPLEVVASGDVAVMGDRDGLRSALDNLVGNALIHTPDDASVTIRVGAEGGEAVISVEDSGPGLDAEALEHAFDRFWRRDTSRSRATGGTGLGLAIVDAVVRGHEGSVAVANMVEGGARFTIRLPLAPSGTGTTGPPRSDASLPT